MASYMWIPEELRSTPIHPIFARENFLAASHDDVVIAYLRKRTAESDLPNSNRDLQAFVAGGGQIHPGWNDSVYAKRWGVFDYCQFIDDRADFPLIDIDVYHRLQPALRLASRFLELAMPFLHRVRWGRTSEHRSRTRPGKRGRVFELLTPDEELPPEQRLASFAQELRTHIAAHVPLFQTPTLTNAYMRSSRFGSGHRVSKPIDWRISSVQIASSFWGAFLNRDQWKTLDLYSQRGEQLESAVILIHELAHVVYHFSRASADRPERRKEAFFDAANLEDQARPELGHALDRWIFGGGPVRSIKYGILSRGVRWYWGTTKYDDEKQHLKATTPDMFAPENAVHSPYQLFEDGAWLAHQNQQHHQIITPFTLALTPVRAFGELLPNAAPYGQFDSDLDRLAIGRQWTVPSSVAMIPNLP